MSNFLVYIASQKSVPRKEEARGKGKSGSREGSGAQQFWGS